MTVPTAPEVPDVEVDVPPAPLGGQPAPTGRSPARRILTSLAAAVGAVIALILVFRFIGEAVDLVDGLVNDPSKASTVDLFTQAIYIGIAATGLNILTGYNGQVSLGHGAFFGVGAYTSAILMFDHDWSFLPTLPVSMAICFVSGAVIGFPALRVKGLYLALVTLGLAVLFPDLTDKFVNGTGGTNLISLRGEQLQSARLVFLVPRLDRRHARLLRRCARPMGLLPDVDHCHRASRLRVADFSESFRAGVDRGARPRVGG